MTYHPQDISPFYYTSITKQHRNKVGWLGAFCAAWLFYLFGIMTYEYIYHLSSVCYSAVSYYALYVSKKNGIIIAGWCTLFVELRGVIFLPLELALTCFAEWYCWSKWSGAITSIYRLYRCLCDNIWSYRSTFFVITYYTLWFLLRGLFCSNAYSLYNTCYLVISINKNFFDCIKFFVRIVKNSYWCMADCAWN